MSVFSVRNKISAMADIQHATPQPKPIQNILKANIWENFGHDIEENVLFL